MIKYIFHTLLFLIFLSYISYSQKNWIVQGYVLDSISKNPITNASVVIGNLGIEKETDSSGYFIIYSVPGGEYTIKISAEGYKEKSHKIVMNETSADTNITIYMFSSSYTTQTIEVYDEYFKKEKFSSTSVSSFSYQEMYRSVGAVEDIIRYFRNTAGVSVENDQYNGLIVRGGAPTENLIMIDGMELPNPNHFGPPGSSYGILSYINLNMVNKAVFYTGGFPANYGGKISSILDIKFREGLSKKHSANVNFSIVGFGGFFEGPLTKKGSYIFSIRRSYFELVKEQLNMEAFPNYWDLNYKLNYRFNNNSILSLFGVAAWDKARPFVKQSNIFNPEHNFEGHKNADINLSNIGLKYTLNNKSGLFSLLFSNNYSVYKANYEGDTYFKIDVKDIAYNLKTEYTGDLDSTLFVKVSSEVSACDLNYDVYANGNYSLYGYISPDIDYIFKDVKYKYNGSVNLSTDLFNKVLQLNAGIRFDYFSLMNYSYAYSPRVGVILKLSSKLFLNASWGIYTQAPEVLWLISDIDNRNLKYIKSDGYVLGAEYFFSKTIRLNAECYYKWYRDYPISVYNPYYIFINSGVSIYPNFLDKAVSAGKGYYKGIDITLEKRSNGVGLYGQLVFSISNSRFKTLYGNGQRGEFDFGKQFLAMLGYRLNANWAFGVRAKYSEGKPCTPYVFDNNIYWVPDRTKINTERLPYYLRIDARIDSYFKIGPVQTSLYFEVENIFDKKNVYDGYFSRSYGDWSYYYQWSILPIMGLNIKL
ncbi:MAG: TonB-dependent receptor [Ignavibacteriae bacterium]|nr:MAG: TonB-dependent receptor [Ignavibacteriota bacterium]